MYSPTTKERMMVAIEWGYLAKHGDNPPTLELDVTEAELAEARETLNSSEYAVWVGEVSSGAVHAEAMAEARRMG
jgi:hypothetical protein